MTIPEPTHDDPVMRPMKRQIREGVGWGLFVAVLTFFGLIGHSLRDVATAFFLVHMLVVTAGSTLVFVGIRKWQQRLRRRLMVRRGQP
jgi:hypothetical protein